MEEPKPWRKGGLFSEGKQNVFGLNWTRKRTHGHNSRKEESHRPKAKWDNNLGRGRRGVEKLHGILG